MQLFIDCLFPLRRAAVSRPAVPVPSSVLSARLPIAGADQLPDLRRRPTHPANRSLIVSDELNISSVLLLSIELFDTEPASQARMITKAPTLAKSRMDWVRRSHSMPELRVAALRMDRPGWFGGYE